MTSVLIPLHNSALSIFDSSDSCHELFTSVAGICDRDAGCGDSGSHDPTVNSRGQNRDVQILTLQSHSEGAFWSGLLPLLSSPVVKASGSESKMTASQSWRHLISAVSILVEQFGQCIHPLHYVHGIDQDDGKCNNEVSIEHGEVGSFDGSLKGNVVLHHNIFGSWLLVSIPVYHQLNTSSQQYDASNKVVINTSYARLVIDIPLKFQPPTTKKSTQSLIITILPPNPYHLSIQYSRKPPTSPTSYTSTLLILYENHLIRLQSMSAYISTLGGGYFLCHHLSTAISLARKQCALALMRGDEDMAWRCRINEGYCYFHGGKLRRGKKVVKGVLREVVERLIEKHGLDVDGEEDLSTTSTDARKAEVCNLTIIKNMCLSALWFADRIKEAKLNEHGVHPTHDDFKRIRVVTDRSCAVEKESISFKPSSKTVTFTDSRLNEYIEPVSSTDGAEEATEDLPLISSLNISTVESELTSDDSTSTTKLIELMKEQVSLVKDLTNAQIADKKELEQLKQEKEKLEREARDRDACVEVMREQLNVVRDLTNAQIADKNEMEKLRQENERLAQEAKEREKARVAAAIEANRRQNLTRINEEENSGRSLIGRILELRGPRSSAPPGSKRHPDAQYYENAPGAGVNYTGPQTDNSKDKIEIIPIPERNVLPPKKKTCISVMWLFFSYLVTLFIPNVFLCCIGRHIKYTQGMTTAQKKEAKSAKGEAKQAWREKVALCVIMFLFCSMFLGVSGVLPVLLCRENTMIAVEELPVLLCPALNYTMYAIMVIIAAVLAIQCICSLIYLFRCKRIISRDDTRSKIIVMVPCYNEGDKELRKTIDSVMDSSYPDDNKVLLVICDGTITGKGERRSTPETLSRLLGYTQDSNATAYKCKSIGEMTENRASLYYGRYRDCGKELNFIVVVKVGIPSEKGSPRAGNRGKRDSQLLFTGLLNRFHHGRELNDLDIAMKNALEHLQLPLDEIRYLMAIDADTRIDRESISHMAFSMNKNDRILALCGETKVENKTQSWVTMVQVFEYYINHHMKKAFESAFGCVTCLPGCFTMYRLFSDDGRSLLSCDDIYQRYSTNDIKTLHDKNLFHLGEDRMLTTLLLTFFPDMRLSFVPEAYCYTIVPHTFSILLSQRRRWINSTFHNMLELVRVNTMCGLCCFSMKTVVVLDLVGTLILPASLIYVAYIVFITVMGEPLSKLMLITWGIVLGVQVVVFLLRSRWDYWWWFFVFLLLGVPVFYFILPIYSFWHMDDFSWGATRQVAAAPPSPSSASKKQGHV